LNDEIEVRAYPNPSFDRVSLHFEKPMSDVQMRLTDAAGNLVWERYYDPVERQNLELGPSSGLYFLKIKTHHGQAVLKLIKH